MSKLRNRESRGGKKNPYPVTDIMRPTSWPIPVFHSCHHSSLTGQLVTQLWHGGPVTPHTMGEHHHWPALLTGWILQSCSFTNRNSQILAKCLPANVECCAEHTGTEQLLHWGKQQELLAVDPGGPVPCHGSHKADEAMSCVSVWPVRWGHNLHEQILV